MHYASIIYRRRKGAFTLALNFMNLCALNVARQMPRPRWPIRLLMGWYRISKNEILNDGDVTHPIDLAQLKQIMNRLKGQGIDVESGRVDYVGLAHHPLFQTYSQAVRALQIYDLTSMQTDAVRKAFWINIYNLLIIHGVIAYGVRRTITEIRGAFQRIAYSIGGYRYSLDDIEHGILRANSGHPFLPGPQFATDDPRLAFALSHKDPRVHFALVCASRSCPPINLYQSDRIDEQLELATHNFINNGGVVLDKANNCVSLSRIFQWYAPDFGGNIWNATPILYFVANYLDESEDRNFMQSKAEGIKVRYQPYDWTLNA